MGVFIGNCLLVEVFPPKLVIRFCIYHGCRTTQFSINVNYLKAVSDLCNKQRVRKGEILLKYFLSILSLKPEWLLQSLLSQQC